MYLFHNLDIAPVAAGMTGAFEACDTNFDQVLDAKELQRCMGAANSDREATFRRVDCDQNGEISFSEFFLLASNLWPQMRDASVKEVFQAFDKDHDWFLSRNEVEKAVREDWISGPELDDLMKSYDSNKDGKV